MSSSIPPSTFSSSFYLLSQEHDLHQHSTNTMHRKSQTAPQATQSAPVSPARDRRRTVGCDGDDDDVFMRAGSFRSFFKKPQVPKPHRRKVSLPTIELTRSDSTDSGDTCTTAESSTCNNDNDTRSVNLFDLIDEEFVVNCGVFASAQQQATAETAPKKHRKRRSILDMIDRIDLLEGDDEDESSSFMTERSYPRGVYVVPPTESQHTKGNVGFVAADALQWREC